MDKLCENRAKKAAAINILPSFSKNLLIFYPMLLHESSMQQMIISIATLAHLQN